MLIDIYYAFLYTFLYFLIIEIKSLRNKPTKLYWKERNIFHIPLHTVYYRIPRQRWTNITIVRILPAAVVCPSLICLYFKLCLRDFREIWKHPEGPYIIFEPATSRSKSLFKGQLHYNASEGSMQGIRSGYSKNGVMKYRYHTKVYETSCWFYCEFLSYSSFLNTE